MCVVGKTFLIKELGLRVKEEKVSIPKHWSTSQLKKIDTMKTIIYLNLVSATVTNYKQVHFTSIFL